MDYLAHGWSVEEICYQYPHLRPAEVFAAMGYYYDHKEEIDAEIAAEEREVEEARKRAGPSTILQKLNLEKSEATRTNCVHS
ncbi:MAG: DUF433 domain-containing protein [Gemmataceae bacterium]|nr:DUF433 domain-containing protein [Gemmataceae bacterium]MCI0741115.1 DUF433 domain-containing protein [Gemmataceae bacterium]